MSSPEMKRRVSQLRHDVDDVYLLLERTNDAVTAAAAVQRRHSSRLEEIQQALDLTVGRLDRIEDNQRGQTTRLDGIENNQREQGTRLDRIEDNQREQGAMLVEVLAVLRGRAGADRDPDS